MPKINQEEYEILKELIGESVKWICRDEEGFLFVHKIKPIKGNAVWLYGDGSSEIRRICNSDLFQFVQWEDPEPYDISELIEDYEKEKEINLSNDFDFNTLTLKNLDGFRKVLGEIKESEETQVKKDLKEAILGIEVTQFDGQKADLEELVNPKQLEEIINDWMPEVLSQEWLDENVVHVRGLGDIIEAEAVESLLLPKQKHFSDTLEEGVHVAKDGKMERGNMSTEYTGKKTEVKGIEWLKKEIKENYTVQTMSGYDTEWKNRLNMDLEELMRLIDQLDEPEVTLDKAFEKVAESYSMTKEEVWRHLERLEAHGGVLSQGSPVIPRFVADWIEERKSIADLWFEALEDLAFDEHSGFLTDEGLEVHEWVVNNLDIYVDAYRFGYEVEEEYYARIKGWENVTTGSESFNWVYFKETDAVGISKAVENKYQSVSFTKKDWNNLGINEHNADFILVEELEE